MRMKEWAQRNYRIPAWEWQKRTKEWGNMSLRMTNESEYEYNSVWMRTKEWEWNNEYERKQMQEWEWKHENERNRTKAPHSW